MNKLLRTIIAIITIFSISSSMTAFGENKAKKGDFSDKAVPVEKVIEQKGDAPTILKDNQGRILIIDKGTFKLPRNTVQEIAAKGKKKKGGDGKVPSAPKPPGCFEISCTESNWYESCNEGKGQKLCKQWTCLCASEQGGDYRNGMAVCGTCQNGGGIGTDITIPETLSR